MVPTGQEQSVVDFVPSAIADTKKDEGYRYVATRELLPKQPLPGVDPQQLNLPFAATRLGPRQRLYKISAIVTNRQLPGDEIIWWHRQRCGKDEPSHGELKGALAGGQMPSGDFGENAAWWACAVRADNLNQAMKLLKLPGEWVGKRLKAIRARLINLPGRVVTRSRQLVIRLTAAHPSNWLIQAVCRGVAKIAQSQAVI
ncbi:MAG: transposase [Candidatus Schekmanbacteria bacterium]|nr:transposase [Candidatus Schekmanbacteria bacterium]